MGRTGCIIGLQNFLIRVRFPTAPLFKSKSLIMDNQIILTQTTKDALLAELLEGVSGLLQDHKKQSLDSKEWLTAKEVQSLLKISPVTLWNYDNKGITKPHKVGRQRRYRKDHVLTSLKKIESKRA